MHIVPGLPEFIDRYPDLKLDMRVSDSVVDLVEGAFDVAVRYTELSDSSFVARRLAPDRRVVVASPDYLERHGYPNLQRARTDHLVGTGAVTVMEIAAIEVQNRRLAHVQMAERVSVNLL